MMVLMKRNSEHPDHREKFGIDQWPSSDQEIHRRSHTVLSPCGLNPRAVPWKPLPSKKPQRTSHFTNGEEEKKGEQLKSWLWQHYSPNMSWLHLMEIL